MDQYTLVPDVDMLRYSKSQDNQHVSQAAEI